MLRLFKIAGEIRQLPPYFNNPKWTIKYLFIFSVGARDVKAVRIFDVADQSKQKVLLNMTLVSLKFILPQLVFVLWQDILKQLTIVLYNSSFTFVINNNVKGWNEKSRVGKGFKNVNRIINSNGIVIHFFPQVVYLFWISLFLVFKNRQRLYCEWHWSNCCDGEAKVLYW